jgi:hypothetical protein
MSILAKASTGIVTRTLLAAAALFAAGAPALAQDAPDQEVRPSRISPRQPGLVSPPQPTLVPGAVAPPRDDGPGALITMPGLAEGVRLCMAVVSPQYDVRPRILTADGWAFTEPRRRPDGQMSYETIQFFKNDRVIALLDYGSLVICRSGGRIENAQQLGRIRASLIEALGAVPIGDVPGLAPLAARIRTNAPQTDLANVLIAGDYSLEISVGEAPLGGRATPSSQTIHLVMVTSIPLPVEFRPQARASAAQ